MLASPPGGSGEAEARLRADSELCHRFREQKYQGPDWDAYVIALLGYGIARMRLLLVSGIIFEEGTVFGVPRRCRGLLDQPGELDELIDDVVLEGFKIFFRKGLVDGQWSPSRGASLTTYFIGACKLAFKDVYRARHKLHRRVTSHENLCDDLGPYLVDRCTMPDACVEEQLDRLTSLLGDETMKIFRMIRDGYSLREIANALGTTEKAIEGKVARARRKARASLSGRWRDE